MYCVITKLKGVKMEHYAAKLNQLIRHAITNSATLLNEYGGDNKPFWF